MTKSAMMLPMFAAVVLAGCDAPADLQQALGSDDAQPGPVAAAHQPGAESELPEGTVFTVEIGEQGPRPATLHHDAAVPVVLAADAAAPKEAGGAALALAPAPKLRPELRGMSGPITVIVELAEDYQLSRLPRLAHDETRESPSWAKKAELIQQHIHSARAARGRSQERLTRLLAAGGATIRERHWLVNGFSATIDASQLAVLAADPQVKEVSPSVGGHLLADIVTGRSAMNSDPYFNTANLNTGWIALLDSGVRTSHSVLAGRTTWVRDCVNGLTNNCGTAGAGLTLDPSDIVNHGTGVASVMSGTDALGFNKRGVTGINMDSFRVVVPGGAISYDAVIRGYAAAVAGGDNAVNASFDCYSSVCTTAANNAFDAGLVVVAAAGNTGDNHIGDPASGKKVLAVGALDPASWTRVDYSSYGPSATQQTKPDLMAVSGGPSGSLQVASNAGNATFFGVGGTSFSSPFVTGGAGLLSRWLRFSFGSSIAIEPGQTNAMLIASGAAVSGATSDYKNGAGRLSLPTSATLYGAKVSVTQGATVDVPISVAAGVTKLDAALFWPEGATHNDVDLNLIRPDGTVAATSTSVNSVWEKVHVDTSTAGTWKLRLRGYAVSGAQTVYVAGIRR